MSERVAVGGRETARERIFEGAVRCVMQNGASASMAEIAAASGVSKALLHYHYADRAHLLADVVTRLSHRIVQRERAAMDETMEDATAAPPTMKNPVDALWSWVDAELQLGELRALLELVTVREAPVRAAWTHAAHHRRQSAVQTIGWLFRRLALSPRIPAALLGDASVAFLDGLALDSGGGRDSRTGFDLFWLALLSFGE